MKIAEKSTNLFKDEIVKVIDEASIKWFDQVKSMLKTLDKKLNGNSYTDPNTTDASSEEYSDDTDSDMDEDLADDPAPLENPLDDEITKWQNKKKI